MNDQNDLASADGGPHHLSPSHGHVADLRARAAIRAERPPRPLDEVTRRAAVIVDDRARRGGGLSETIRQLRRHGVPGYRAELIGAGELDAIGQGPYELVHLAACDPTARAAIELAGEHGLPVVAGAADAPGAALHGASLVLSPTRATDASLIARGVPAGRIARWEPGIDRELFGPARYSAASIPAPRRPAVTPAGALDAPGPVPFHVLCTEALDDEPCLRLLVTAFQAARDRDGRLQLVLAGSGPWQEEIGHELGGAVTVIDPCDAEQLARIYASADLFVSPCRGDGFGGAVLEAQASGLPVLAIDGSGPGELIESGRTGCLVAPDAATLGAAIHGLARRATLRERLITGGLLAVRERTWERALMDLAIAWERALSDALASPEVTRAA